MSSARQHTYSRAGGVNVEEFDDDARLMPPSPSKVSKHGLGGGDGGCGGSGGHAEDDLPLREARWRSFSGICLFVSIVGTGYAFGVLASLLENNLQFSKEENDTIASVGNMGMYMSLLCGFLFEKYGFRVVIGVGAALVFVGFFYLWLAVSHWIPCTVYSVGVFYFLAQVGTCFHIATAITLSVKLFPPQARGTSIGLTKGYFGLSSAVLADIAGGYFKQIPSFYLLFVSLFIPITAFIGVNRIVTLPDRLIPFEYEKAHGISCSLRKMLLHWGALFVTLYIFGYTQFRFEMNDAEETLMAVVIICIVYAILLVPHFYGPYDKDAPRHANLVLSKSPSGGKFGSFGVLTTIYAPAKTGEAGEGGNSNNNNNVSGAVSVLSMAMSEADENTSVDETATMLSRDDDDDDDDEYSTPAAAAEVDRECFYGQSMSIYESIYTFRLWALFIVYMASCGTSLMVIYDVNSITQALSIQPSSFFVALLSLANGLGRVTGGFLSDKLPKYFNISKLEMLGFLVACMGVAQNILALGSSMMLQAALLVIGFLFGSNTSIMVVNVADIFGGKFISTNFGFVDTAPIFGSYLFATYVVVMTYTANTTDAADVDSCVGPECFSAAFKINAACCYACALLVLYINMITPRPRFGEQAGGCV